MTRLQLVADYFRARPNTWIDAHCFVKLGGFAGFTARIRDLRKPPYHWQIDNRVRYEPRVWGTETITEYRYTPAVTGVTLRRDGVTVEALQDVTSDYCNGPGLQDSRS